MSRSGNEESPWDEELAQGLLGRLVLVGLTFLSHTGELKEQKQFFGKVLRASKSEGILLGLAGRRAGEEFNLPPDTSAFKEARLGEYRLRTTGEVVTDPDFTVTYTITEAAK